MEQKVYITPQLEVTNLGALGRWMKDLANPSDTAAQPAPVLRTNVF